MKNVIIKTKKRREVTTTKSVNSGKMFSEEDIRQRAFEIYQGNGNTSHNELDDWFRAEKELRESDQ